MSQKAMVLLSSFGVAFAVTLVLLLFVGPRLKANRSSRPQEKTFQVIDEGRPVPVPEVAKGAARSLGHPPTLSSFSSDTTQNFSLARVRELAVSAPSRAVEEGEALLRETRDSEEQAEIRWLMARSLVVLGRFAEAREVAREMLRVTPDSPFAQDAERHLLVQPFGLPSREELVLAESN